MKIQELLEAAGCTDMDTTMARVLNDEEFYLMILGQMLEDENFARLQKALEEKNPKVAFDIAHSLKGIIGNCGITPMYSTICSIVEPLRHGSTQDLSVELKTLLRQREQFAAILRQALLE